MPRSARKQSKNGQYYIYAFSDKLLLLTKCDADKNELVGIIKASKEIFEYDLYAYCITQKEVHLAVKENSPLEISNIMKFILSTYTNYYNKKYNSGGTLIHDRFVSRPIIDGKDLKNVIRHIHQLPAKEKECPNVFSYKYSSYNDYFINSPYINSKFVLSQFSDNDKMSLQTFKIFHAMLDLNEYKKARRVTLSHGELAEILSDTMKITEEELLATGTTERLKIAKALRKKSKLSLRQLEEICHVSRSLIAKKELQ